MEERIRAGSDGDIYMLLWMTAEAIHGSASNPVEILVRIEALM